MLEKSSDDKDKYYHESILEKSLDEKEKYNKSFVKVNESFTRDENPHQKQNSMCTTELLEPTFKNSDTCSVGKKLEVLEEIKFHENPLVLILVLI